MQNEPQLSDFWCQVALWGFGLFLAALVIGELLLIAFDPECHFCITIAPRS